MLVQDRLLCGVIWVLRRTDSPVLIVDWPSGRSLKKNGHWQHFDKAIVVVRNPLELSRSLCITLITISELCFRFAICLRFGKNADEPFVRQCRLESVQSVSYLRREDQASKRHKPSSEYRDSKD